MLNATDGTDTYSYTYDNAGNILTANSHTYTYGNANWKNLLTAFDGQTISYDGSGNPTSYYNGTRWTFDWKNGRELATATDGTTNISYDYDANGLRTTKTVDGVIHTYYYGNDGKLLREIYDTHILDFFYNPDGAPHALRYNGTYFYYVTNLQGDVIRVVDADGVTVCEYQYDPYGNILSKTATDVWIEISDAENDSTNIFEDLNDLLEDMGNADVPADGELLERSVDLGEINPLRYRGYYYDTETELYYLQSRYYDPVVGRFINADVFASTGQGILGNNMFAYCNNDPINNSDPSGKALISAMIGGGIAGALIGATSYLISNGISGKPFDLRDFVETVGVGFANGALGGAAGAIGGIAKPIISLTVGIISGLNAVDGATESDKALGIATGLVAMGSTYLGASINTAGLGKIATGIVNYATTLMVSLPAEVATIGVQTTIKSNYQKHNKSKTSNQTTTSNGYIRRSYVAHTF